jgi:hypothetical protein
VRCRIACRSEKAFAIAVWPVLKIVALLSQK